VGFAGDDLVRYSRHLLMAEVGPAGQAALRAAHVVLVGRGSAARTASTYLCAAGVGQLTVLGPASATPPPHAVPPGTELTRLPEPSDAESLVPFAARATCVGLAGAPDLRAEMTFGTRRAGVPLATATTPDFSFGPTLEGALVAAEVARLILGLRRDEAA
jgi:hypothetical protein